MDENCFVLRNALDNGTDEGLRFRNFFVQPSEPNRLYRFKEKIDELSIWEDEQGGLAWRKAWDKALYRGLNIVNGKVVYKAVADVFGLEYEEMIL